MLRLVLASQSPRRRRLVKLLGQPVQVAVAAVDEESIDHPDPATNVIRTAMLKAQAVAPDFSNALVIAADTTVAIDGEMLGKPASENEARAMLSRLRGRPHQVFTGLFLLHTGNGRVESSVCSTEVVMRPYSDAEVTRYLASGDPFDKAGAYAIQNSRFHPVARIGGCYTNVVGLCLCRLCALLRRFGLDSSLKAAESTGDYRDCATCLKLMEDEVIDFGST